MQVVPGFLVVFWFFVAWFAEVEAVRQKQSDQLYQFTKSYH